MIREAFVIGSIKESAVTLSTLSLDAFHVLQISELSSRPIDLDSISDLSIK